jgi:hypothetical protein
MTQIVDQSCEFEKALYGQPLGRHGRLTRRRHIPVGPFTSNRDAAACRLTQDQRLGFANTPGFEDRKALSLQGMEWMSNLSPSQRLVGNLGSPL